MSEHEKVALQVLIVEDTPLAQKVAVMVMKTLGCQVDAVGTGAEAIAQFTQHHYDFVFMDLGLPDMDGYLAGATIRELEAKKHTPIVALTAHTGDTFRERVLEAKMDDFMSKPITSEKAKAMLAKHVEKFKSEAVSE